MGEQSPRTGSADVQSTSLLLDELLHVFKEQLITPTASGYDKKIKQYFNGILQQFSPLAFLEIRKPEDVVAAIEICKAHKAKFCVRGGGCGDYAVANNAIVLDMSHLNKVIVDPSQKTVSVEAGCKLSDVDRCTVAHNLAVTLGTASFIGVSGQSLDLGMGFLGRSCGYLIDNILAYDLVLSNGGSIFLTESYDPDLFWAMKGHGANFGAVTKYHYRLHTVAKEVVAGSVYFKFEEAVAVLKHVRDFQLRMNDDWNLAVYGMMHVSSSGLQVFYRFFYNGASERGMELADELLKTCPAQSLYCNIGLMTYDAFQKHGDHLFEFGLYCYAHPGHFLKDLQSDIIRLTVEAFGQLDPQLHSSTTAYFVPLGGAMEVADPESSPFPFRHAKYWVGVIGACKEKAQFSQVSQWLEVLARKVDPFAMRPDPVLCEQNNNRLSRVKLQYDPDNLFCFCPCNVLPSRVER